MVQYVISDTTPSVEETKVTYVVPECSDQEVACQGLTINTIAAAFSFVTNVAASYNVIVDVSRDGIYNFIGNEDVRLSGTTVVGSNTVTWDGLDFNGDPVVSGLYSARVFVSVAEIHFPLYDMETSYPGLYM